MLKIALIVDVSRRQKKRQNQRLASSESSCGNASANLWESTEGIEKGRFATEGDINAFWRDTEDLRTHNHKCDNEGASECFRWLTFQMETLGLGPT